MNAFTPTDLQITDHALLRWMERVHGVDVEGWRNLMRDDLDTALASYDGQRDLSVPGFVVVDDHVVTVLSAGHRSKKSQAEACVVVPRVAS